MESSRPGDKVDAPQIIPCARMSHYPKNCWHAVGKEIANFNANGKVIAVVESAGRSVEIAERQFVPKPLVYPVIIKSRVFESDELQQAHEFITINSIPLGMPGAKIKPPMLSELPDRSYVVSIVMARLSGQPLDQLLFEEPGYRNQRRLTMPALVRLELMLEMAFSLEAAHACGIVHRDITAGNVMVDVATGKATIFDFDLAKFAGDVDRWGVGTPIFMSEEAFESRVTTYKTDVRGLAWIFYMMLDGVLPEINKKSEAEHYARFFEVKGLFTTIQHELSQSDRYQLTDLLRLMFKRDQEDRCDLSHCIRVLETILLQHMLDQRLPPNRVAYRQAYCLGRDVRLILVKEAFEKRIGGQPTSDILALFERALALLPKTIDALEALPVFLSALRVNLLQGLNSAAEVKRKVQETLTSFSRHHTALQNLRTEAVTCRDFLARHKSEGEMKELIGVFESIGYLLWYSRCYSWTLDNLADFSRKFAKKVTEVSPVVAGAKAAVEGILSQQRILQRLRLMPPPLQSHAPSSAPPPKKRARFQ